MKPLSRRCCPRQTAAPGAAEALPGVVIDASSSARNRKRVGGHSPRSHGSHQLGCSPCRDDRRVAPLQECAGVLSPRRGQKAFALWRVHALVCTLLDTGCRIDELLTANFDQDDLLLTVIGEGDKQIVVRVHLESPRMEDV